MRYKVTIQPIGEDAGYIPQALQSGILCEGCMIVVDLWASAAAYIRKMDIADIAKILTKDERLMNAARIALFANTLSNKRKEE